MPGLLREQTTAPWEQLRIVQISSAPSLHEPFDTFSTFLQGARFRPSRFAISSICTIRYFAGAVQDDANEHDSISLRRRICTAAPCEMLLCVIEGFLDCFFCQQGNAVFGCVYCERSLHILSILNWAVAPRRNHHYDTYSLETISFFQFERP